MAGDKYSAIWVSHTSISDFLQCPRAYYLKHVYRDPKTGRKIKQVTPPLTLGQVVHEVLESLSVLPAEKRFNESVLQRYEDAWKKVSGKRGGFTSKSGEEEYMQRGKEMIQRVMKNPGPLLNLAVKIKMDLPYFWLSEEDNIILCGKIDWLEYLPESDTVHIIDFKTSKTDEDSSSLQLPIYHLLTLNCQKRDASKASYWYIARSDDLSEVPLPNAEESHEKILKIARQIKVARQLEKFSCPETNGCFACKPMESIVKGEAEYVGVDGFNQDAYILDRTEKSDDEIGESVVL